MAARIQSVSSNIGGGVTTLDTTLPSGSQLGDLIIAVIQSVPGGASLTGATGTIQSQVTLESAHGSAQYKILDSTDISNGYLTVTQGSGDLYVGLFRITGSKKSSFFGTPVTGSSSGNNFGLSTVTFGSVDDAVIVCSCSGQGSTGQNFGCSPADGGATSSTKLSIGNGTVQGGIGVFEVTRATAGSTGTMTMTRAFTGNAFVGFAFLVTADVGPSNLKSYNTNLKENIKTIDTNPIANIKSLNTNV